MNNFCNRAYDFDSAKLSHNTEKTERLILGLTTRYITETNNNDADITQAFGVSMKPWFDPKASQVLLYLKVVNSRKLLGSRCLP